MASDQREVITKCFHKAGIQKLCPWLHIELSSGGEVSDEENAETTAEVAKLWNELVDHGGVGNDVNLDGFISVDAYAVTTEEPGDVMAAIDILQRYAGGHSLAQALLVLLAHECHIMSTLIKKRQAVLMDFTTA